jgi:hypothetical protein
MSQSHAWFSLDLIPSMIKNLRGKWKDERKNPSYYTIKVTSVGQRYIVLLDTQRPTGAVSFNGPNIYVQNDGNRARIVWGISHVK